MRQLALWILILICCLVFWIGFFSIFNIFGYAYGATQTFDKTRAVIHHTNSHDVSIDTVRRWHVNDNGWDDVGYHFLIRANGDIEAGRPIGFHGAHAKGRNHYIGIALTGYDEFTAQQLESLLNLLVSLKIENIERHHERCPSEGIDVEALQNVLNKHKGRYSNESKSDN